jgi:hypothetical protein
LTEEGAVEGGARTLSMVPDACFAKELPFHITHIAAPSTAYHLKKIKPNDITNIKKKTLKPYIYPLQVHALYSSKTTILCT